MEELRGTIVKKILGKTKIKTVLTELQDQYAGSEQGYRLFLKRQAGAWK